MVVEENRTSSNSTGSDTRIASNSIGGSNSKTHVTEMELGIVSSQDEQTAEYDKNAEGGLGGDSPSFLDTGQNTNTDSGPHIGPGTSHQTESVVSKEEKTDVEQVDKAHETSVCDKSICNVTVYERNKCAQNVEALSQEQITHCKTEIQAPLESLSNQVSDNSGSTCNELQNNPAGGDLEGHVENVVVIDNSESAKNEKDELLETGIGAYSKDDICAEEDNDPFQVELDEECYEGISEHIPKCYWKTPLKCFSYNTVTLIGYRLDALEEAHDGVLAKDFTGLCDRINLDPAFTRYLVKSQIKGKTEEILSKWEVLPVGTGPRPTVGNFSKIVYYDLDRPDVIEDLHQYIVRDAEKWEATKKEAKTYKPDDEDNSWQLTRHDVATGKKTFYTACLCYADEDEGMATLITNFFQTVWKDTRFFRPQFDLKMGRYVCDTTAKVIEERCNGKVIFILSDYFYASQVCQFAVNFSHQVDAAAEQGNLIPFYLTNQYDKAPKVLKGIAGVRWARSQFRYHSWGQLTDCLISKEDNSNQSEVSEIQDRIKVELEHHSSSWLCDPPYDKDTPKPGPALPLNEPLSDSVNSSSCFDPDGDDNSPIVDSNKSSSDSAPFYRRLFHRIRKVLPGTRRKMRSRPIRAEDLNRAFREESGPSGVV